VHKGWLKLMLLFFYLFTLYSTVFAVEFMTAVIAYLLSEITTDVAFAARIHVSESVCL